MKRIVVGLMSGTSMDGVDAALGVVTGSGESCRFKPLGFISTPYPKRIREELLEIGQAHNRSPNSTQLASLNFRLGELFAQAAERVVRSAGRSLRSVNIIGSHGQTVFHHPRGRERATLQLGEAAVIAERTGVTTVADFRPADVASGGEGAPLTPYVHYLLFRNKRKSRAVHNLGGISNLTYLPAGAGMKDILAFDTGPGNMIIDELTGWVTRGKLTFDRRGVLARKGRVQTDLLKELMRHRFLSAPPPKSAGREEFGRDFISALRQRAKKKRIRPLDLLATATAFTAASIGKAYNDFVLRRRNGVDEIYFTGGGRKNRTLMEMLARELPFAKVSVIEDLGYDGDALEAQAFAILANEAVEGHISNLPGITGAKHGMVLGKIVPGKNFLRVRLK
ncbi:MAG: anhydro-N-acetylmuramic acid kinase [Deltaproteobacteria bacterium]|nr:anhydro-N-acetylmuramic acid kinase [Deltaproteobacteria bacterium]